MGDSPSDKDFPPIPPGPTDPAHVSEPPGEGSLSLVPAPPPEIANDIARVGRSLPLSMGDGLMDSLRETSELVAKLRAKRKAEDTVIEVELPDEEHAVIRIRSPKAALIAQAVHAFIEDVSRRASAGRRRP